IFLIETREEVSEILQYHKYINLVIPRGSNEFVQYIQKNSSIPVLGHADGICHLYVDKDANISDAVKITMDSKTQYVAVCNALETLLVHKDIASLFLPKLKIETDKKNVVLKGDKETKRILVDIEDATEIDWKTEYLDYILSVKIVSNIDEAIEHINFYGSGHTDGIVSSNKNNIELFKSLVDTASVMVNCSTRFSDGYRYGFGAEVGISTNKIHARGPVGLEGLVIYKYILEGSSDVVADYSEGRKNFKHKKIL
ncbi:MAG TPA: glutamate-5-semialdehyde dehydrogenase, partial [Spirochaetota bacterium]|nr:glutamate-5-semialdehyde dehydrogenase [Spirochaetota bacterium]